MKIAIFVTNSKTEYSGGRYHSWMMAEALVFGGHSVYVVTNNLPIFYDDFSSYPNHKDIKVCITADFKSDLPNENFDVVVLIPNLEKRPDFFLSTVFFARKNNSRLVLLNFETPNWFNELSPEPRDPSLWFWWKEVGVVSDMIISFTKVSKDYAKAYFKCKKTTMHRYCYPSINSIIAKNSQVTKKKKQIICISRFIKGHRHKGGYDIIDAIGPEMKGFTLSIIIGAGEIDSDMAKLILNKAEKFGVSVRFLYRLSDRKKFEEIKKSILMLFLSHFEGFGYPPVESQFCDVPCIVYDLPVLREVSGDGLIYVSAGDITALHRKIESVISGKYSPPFSLYRGIEKVATIEFYAERVDMLMQELISVSNEPNVLNIPLLSRIRWCYLIVKHRLFNLIKKIESYLYFKTRKIFKS
ncbi:MAG: glycosyltransferase [Candidatus Aminicenantes bacterium]|nr:glycosyltransferase [Candidatus Aminicenantes bacterium]